MRVLIPPRGSIRLRTQSLTLCQPQAHPTTGRVPNPRSFTRSISPKQTLAPTLSRGTRSGGQRGPSKSRTAPISTSRSGRPSPSPLDGPEASRSLGSDRRQSAPDRPIPALDASNAPPAVGRSRPGPDAALRPLGVHLRPRRTSPRRAAYGPISPTFGDAPPGPPRRPTRRSLGARSRHPRPRSQNNHPSTHPHDPARRCSETRPDRPLGRLDGGRSGTSGRRPLAPNRATDRTLSARRVRPSRPSSRRVDSARSRVDRGAAAGVAAFGGGCPATRAGGPGILGDVARRLKADRGEADA